MTATTEALAPEYGEQLRSSDYYLQHGKTQDAEAIEKFVVSRARYKSSRYCELHGAAYDAGYRLAAYYGQPRAMTLIELAKLAQLVRPGRFDVVAPGGFRYSTRRTLVQAVILRQSTPGARVARSRAR